MLTILKGQVRFEVDSVYYRLNLNSAQIQIKGI